MLIFSFKYLSTLLCQLVQKPPLYCQAAFKAAGSILAVC